MKIDRTFLHSKVARRIFVSFILCALVPIGGLAILSFGLVSKQLGEQSRQRLHQASKSAGMALVQKLHLLDTGMERFAFHDHTRSIGDEEADKLRPSFDSLVLVSSSGSVTSLYGSMRRLPTLDAAERERIASGRSALVVQYASEGVVNLYLCRLADLARPNEGILIGRIESDYLWRTETLPPMTELLILDEEDRTLFSTLPGTDMTSGYLRGGSSNQFEWTFRGQTYIAYAWTIPLKFSFGVSRWTIVLSESKADVLAPMTNFKTLFPLVILVSLWLVALLSIGQIRRNLIPLEKLQKGTRRIAVGDFKSEVDVSSGDEFEELAGSFNSMATQLGRQFDTLSTMAKLDRAILSTWDTRGIVDTLLDRLPDLSPCDCVGVTILDSEFHGVARSFFKDTSSTDRSEEFLFEVDPGEQIDLGARAEGRMLAPDQLPSYLAPLRDHRIGSTLVLPVFLKGKLSAVIALGHHRRKDYGSDDRRQARQVADRVAVALSNARLVEELDRLHWGTLIALARTIDAKSPWTAGHSERAAEMSLKIGRLLGLEKEELDNLHRGALLHDIGKIGIPPDILDKQGKLTEEELKLMQDHPRIGARILEPINAYARSIPVVAQHHEWWDGSGYPNGLRGEEIDLLARIYAVADVYDALISDRPYRPGLSRKEVIDFIEQKAGTQFAPPVVEAFLELMVKERKLPQSKSLHASPLLST
jgi:HAMP domain-containing protein